MQRPFNYSVHIQNFKRLLTFAACAKSVVSEQATSKLPVCGHVTGLNLSVQCYTNLLYKLFQRLHVFLQNPTQTILVIQKNRTVYF